MKTLALTLLVIELLLPQVTTQQQSVTTQRSPLPKTSESTDDGTEQELPAITYGRQRHSSKWVETSGGTRVAVDEGILYDGIKYYLGLTWELVAVDSKTEQTIWSKHVSAYWNKLAIEKISPDGAEESQLTVVALRTGRDDESKDQVEFYNLKTGDRIEDPHREKPPEGSVIKPRQSYKGNRCNQLEPLTELVESSKRWLELHDRIFAEIAEAPPRDNFFDEDKEVLLVIFSGNSYNCSGISAGSVFEQDDQFLVRLHYHTYQSSGKTPQVRPYGLVVLPKDGSKPYVLQRNAQRYIGGPPLWKHFKTLKIVNP